MYPIGATSLLEFGNGSTGHQGDLLRGVDMETVTEFQFVYACSLHSSTQFIGEQKWFKIAGFIYTPTPFFFEWKPNMLHIFC